ncbi:putative ribonuclease H protein [Vitis vinifera]|uniref:Putative ribonuclease H protein n=1 Tax=Vitis vinifera TaxID=29760 RepID=A0A438GC40_VITVI|nr:putative ribonuclease H protein [Vitis vinifera]
MALRGRRWRLEKVWGVSLRSCYRIWKGKVVDGTTTAWRGLARFWVFLRKALKETKIQDISQKVVHKSWCGKILRLGSSECKGGSWWGGSFLDNRVLEFPSKRSRVGRLSGSMRRCSEVIDELALRICLFGGGSLCGWRAEWSIQYEHLEFDRIGVEEVARLEEMFSGRGVFGPFRAKWGQGTWSGRVSLCLLKPEHHILVLVPKKARLMIYAILTHQFGGRSVQAVCKGLANRLKKVVAKVKLFLPLIWGSFGCSAQVGGGVGWRGREDAEDTCLVKRQFISKEGRITLIRSTLVSMPTYLMSLMRMPRIVKMRLEKVQRDFLWGEGALEKRPHLVKWVVVCSHKKKGGSLGKKVEGGTPVRVTFWKDFGAGIIPFVRLFHLVCLSDLLMIGGGGGGEASFDPSRKEASYCPVSVEHHLEPLCSYKCGFFFLLGKLLGEGSNPRSAQEEGLDFSNRCFLCCAEEETINDILSRAGSQIIWIAPSGGRDRPDPLTKEWHPVSFCTLIY